MHNFLLKLVFILFLYAYAVEAKSCDGSAKYTLRFRGEWTSARHADFPLNPHFSASVGCSHKAAYVMWRPGTKATTGVKDVAELGSTSALNREMDSQISSKNAYKRNSGSVRFGGTASDSIPNIEVTSEYPLVSFINMIAPSPDWFLGVRDLNLCNTTTGEWQDQVVRDLFPYDAGTDSGLNFESGNDPTSPPEDIHRITNNTEGSLKGDEPIKSFGTFTFGKTSETGKVTSAPTNTLTGANTPSATSTGTNAPSTGTNAPSTGTNTPSRGTNTPSANPAGTAGLPIAGTAILQTTPTGTNTPSSGRNILSTNSTGTATPPTTPTDTANPGTNFNITLVLILCILNISNLL